MDQLAHLFRHDKQNSTAITLLLLGVIEQATRYSIGCEGFFGWWPREDENVPSGISEGYSQLLKLLLQKPCHDVGSLATHVLHRLRFYEVASRYEVSFEFCVLMCICLSVSRSSLLVSCGNFILLQCAVLSVLGGLSSVSRVTSVTLNMLISAKSQLKRLLVSWNSVLYLFPFSM